jgi:chromosome transmission fidelity protein 18
LDELIAFSRIKCSSIDHSVRQILDQEYRKESVKKQSESSQFKFTKPESQSSEKTVNTEGSENIAGKKYTRDNPGIKRDFFGRIINDATPGPAKKFGESQRKSVSRNSERSVWVTFHEGFSNAVRKPISMNELLADL